MTRLLTAVVASFTALVLAAPAAAQSRDTETVDRTLAVQPGGTVRLKTFSGRVRITAGTGDQVVIHAVRTATRDRLQDITLDIQQSGNSISIDANHQRVRRTNDNVVETDFEIRVPAQTALDIKTFSAPVVVTGVTGAVEIDGYSGEVRLGDVGGPARIKTFSGDVQLRAQTWREGDGIDIKTFSGDVTLGLPDAARGALSFDSFSGDFNSSLPVTLESTSKRKFRGQLNGGGATPFTLKTFSGDVTIAR